MSAPAIDTRAVEALLRRVQTIEMRVNRLLDSGLAGAYRSVFHGSGIEAEGVREYSIDDDAALIDWQISARVNRPHVRVFREERELLCLLLVDISASMRCRQHGVDARSTAADLAALLALAAVRNRDRVGLLLFSSQTERWVPPARSREQALRVIRDVACFAPRDERTDITLALRTATRLSRQRALIFLISDLAAEIAEPEWCRVARRHDLVVLRLADPRPADLPVCPTLWIEDAETGRCVALGPSAATRQGYRDALTRNSQAAREIVRRSGGGWVDIRCGPTALTALASFLLRRARTPRRTALSWGDRS